MADSIKISTQVLRETAGTINRINGTMDDKLKEINKKMNDLRNTWKSDAGDDIRAAMNALNPRFEKYKEIVSKYSEFLVRTAQDYETTETTIQNNAGQFK